MEHIQYNGVNTTILVSDATRDILAQGRDRSASPSLDAYIRSVLRDATPMAQEVWRRHRKAAEQACRRHKVRRLIAFGSLVRDDRHPASDLDLVAEMPTAGGVRDLFALRDELSLALGVRVDLGDMPDRRSRLWKRIRAEGVALVGPPP
jgi:predicted nucleotidyltransferase